MTRGRVYDAEQLEVYGNHVAGSTGPLYGFAHFKSQVFANNTGHSGGLGIVIKGEVRQPIEDATLYGIRELAIWGYSRSPQVTLRNVLIADAAAGFLWGAIGAPVCGTPHPDCRHTPVHPDCRHTPFGTPSLSEKRFLS